MTSYFILRFLVIFGWMLGIMNLEKHISEAADDVVFLQRGFTHLG